MAGAYNAREPADPADPGFPPGWPGYPWPFPGQSGYDPDPFFPAPFPPGYEPDYLFAVFGTESIAYNGAASITGTFRDHDTYATNEPDVIVWTATVSSSPTRDVKLRFLGDEDYVDSISSVCVFGTYWGATPDIEFELTGEDDGGTVILTGKSAISGSYLAATFAIEISTTAQFTSLTSYSPGVGPEAVLHYPTFDVRNPTDGDATVDCAWARTPGFAPPNVVNQVNGVTETYPYTIPVRDGYITITLDDTGVTASIKYSDLEDNQFIAIKLTTSTLFVSATFVATLVIAGETYTKTIVDSEPVQRWLKIFNDGTVEILNP